MARASDAMSEPSSSVEFASVADMSPKDSCSKLFSNANGSRRANVWWVGEDFGRACQ
jgi:hypothetical protein